MPIILARREKISHLVDKQCIIDRTKFDTDDYKSIVIKVAKYAAMCKDQDERLTKYIEDNEMLKEKLSKKYTQVDDLVVLSNDIYNSSKRRIEEQNESISNLSKMCDSLLNDIKIKDEIISKYAEIDRARQEVKKQSLIKQLPTKKQQPIKQLVKTRIVKYRRVQPIKQISEQNNTQNTIQNTRWK